MPSSLAETLDRELAVRGGVTLGLAPFLRVAYGESDLRGELNRRFKEALDAEADEVLRQILLMEVALGGLLPVRTIGLCAPLDALAPLVVRASLVRDPSGSHLRELAERENAGEELKRLVAIDPSSDGEEHGEDDAVSLAFTRAFRDLFVSPRTMGMADKETKKVGRNDPCPCGSGKKYKRCHAGRSAPRPIPDAAGTPGLTKAEAFTFRGVTETLSVLCHARVVAGGPRPGETLYWPTHEALADEMEVRAAIAGDNRQELKAVIIRAWELQVFQREEIAELLARSFGSDAWWDTSFRAYLGAMPEALRAEVSFTGAGSVDDLIALSHQPGVTGLIARGVEASAADDVACAVDHVLGCLLASALSPALALARFLLASDLRSDSRALRLLAEIELPLALSLDHAPMPSMESPSDAPSQIGVLVRTNKGLSERVNVLQRDLVAERQLRKRAESAWASRSGASDEQEALRHELRRLRHELKDERESARVAIRDVQQFRRRERIRLLRESELEADVVAALVGEIAETETEETSPAGKEIHYLPHFEEAAARVTASTIERLKTQVEAFAQGQWIREAKRMEATDGVWTLRAGLHYRALLKLGEDRIDVFDLIPREELDSVLARLRRKA